MSFRNWYSPLSESLLPLEVRKNLIHNLQNINYVRERIWNKEIKDETKKNGATTKNPSGKPTLAGA